MTQVRRVDIEDQIFLLTPTDVPIIGNSFVPPEGEMGGPEYSAISREDCFQTQIDWQEEELNTPRTTLAATFVTAATFMTVASGEREKFATGDVARIDNEVVRITGYGTTTDTVLTTRAFGGTDAQHSNAVPVVGVGTALPEGSDPSAHRFRDRTKPYNVTQIFGPYEVKVSRTQQTVSEKGGMYGVPDEFGHQVANRVREMGVGLEQAVIYGIRVNDTTNEWRSMGGMVYYIATNVDSTTTDITYALTRTQMQSAWNNGGNVDLLIMGGTQKVKFSGFDATLVRIDLNERVRGSVVGTIQTDFGTANILVDRHMRTADLIGLDSQYASLCTLERMAFEPLGRTGDAEKGQVVGEYSFKLRLEKRHLRFSALT